MLAVVIIVVGIAICFINTFFTVIGTFMMIGGVMVWCMASDKSYNKLSDSARRISDVENLTMSDIYKDRVNQGISYYLATMTLVDEVYDMIYAYVKENKVTAIFSNADQGQIYRFDESFKLTVQRFDMTDMDNNSIYHIEVIEPLRSFHIIDSETEAD